MKQCSDFAVYFYQIRWFDITAFASKDPKVQEVVEITASGPLHWLANIVNYIYSKFHNDLMDQNVKQCTDFAFKAPKVQEVVKITASGSHPFVCKYHKLYIQQIS